MICEFCRVSLLRKLSEYNVIKRYGRNFSQKQNNYLKKK